MPKLMVKPIEAGLRNDKLAFNIDNDSFPTLVNAYQWRGRIKRKRGTSFLGRLTRFFNSDNVSYTPGGTVPYTITLVAGAGNLLSGTYGNGTSTFSLQSNGNIVPLSVSITDTGTSTTYIDNGTGLLVGGAGGTINYATGAFTISGGGTDTVEALFLYYPDLPVMGLEEFVNSSEQFPQSLGFDTTYSYNILTASPYSIYDVSFYKNPPANTFGSNPQKTSVTPTSWNGQDYQQFWTTNFQGALWATNGIKVPFDPTVVGMQFAPASSIAYVSNTMTTLVVTITGSPLVVGDFVFVNEWTASTVANANTLNWRTGFVSLIAGADITITFPNATIANDTFTPGIIQYLTTRSDPTIDCIRWYDGDPTNGNPTAPVLNGNLGWVNFMPPLSRAPLSINDQIAAIYYLVGCRMILPFKDRLLFFGAVIQSSTGAPIYLQDTLVYSQDGTPYYTASWGAGDVSAATTVFTPMLTPKGQVATPNSYFSDQTGYGGYISAGFDQPINTVNPNEDVLLIGFTNRQSRLTYTGDDIIPFNFFTINSELGSNATFSSITVDRGAYTIGPRGIVMTQQIGTQRVDLPIPDQVFQFNLNGNGAQRICAQRDFINEWIYFTYLDDESSWAFPNQTLQYNYRDNTWAIFNESYTTYGQFYITADDTWATIGNRFPTWASWNEPWNAGSTEILQPDVIAGNQQGFIIFRDRGTAESNSLYIQNAVFSSGTLTITSPNHNLNEGDYIVISGVIGLTGLNGNIFQVSQPSTNSFTALGNIIISGSYVGGGLIQRMYIPYIQTKQFPIAWDMARKTRIGNQQYLLTTTANGQITLLIFLSQNDASPYNIGPIVPAEGTFNNSLIYNTVVYTCPESTNLGLTPANINLQMVTGSQQNQIWHRINTSLIGDTVQIGFTLSSAQMTDPTFSSQFDEIELHGFILDVNQSQLLA